MKLILLGAPGAGKGTQAEVICHKLNIPAISTGNIIREAMKAGTEEGLAARKYVEAGNLVPDEVVIAMLARRLEEPDCAGGYILDGFPRNVAQAQALDRMGIVIDKVIDIDVPDEMIQARLSGRRVCENCGAGYHVKHKPSSKGEQCEACDGPLIIRKDDEPGVIQDRLKVYREQTAPLKDYYQSVGKLSSVDGTGDIQAISQAVMAAVEA